MSAASLSRRGFLTGAVSQPRIAETCLSFRGVECRICAGACNAGAIVFRTVSGAVARPELVARDCTGCNDCGAVCPVGAIEGMRNVRE